jgi:curved DNA-binding protein CbpA
MSLYKTLKVKTTATTEEITKAYRKLSMKHHPDRGGNPETFASINQAYEVLSDPVRRSRYDETGDMDKPVDLTVKMGMQKLAMVYAMTIKGMMEHGADVKHVDLVDTMLQVIAHSIDENKKALKNIRQAIKMTTEGIGRVYGDPDNPLVMIMRDAIRNAEQEMQTHEQHEVALGSARNLLEGLTYNVDLMLRRSYGTSWGVATSATTY